MKTKIISIIIILIFTGKVFSQDDGRKVRIPVIFHILYADSSKDNGITTESRNKGNSSQYLTTEKILAELKDLHNDFLLLNDDTSDVLPMYKSIIGNPNIEFYLADTILQIGGEKGIIRIRTKHNHLNQLSKTSKIINPQRYFNVYIGKLNSDGSTYLPIDSNYNSDDAVHLDFLWVGLHYRLLTHEVGHWLGLLHIYGGSGGGKGDKQSCISGDNIDDTPPQRNSTDGLCTNCPSPYGTAIDQSCDKNKPSNYNNYMDYSGCRKMFTKGQVLMMRNIIQKYRPQIWRGN